MINIRDLSVNEVYEFQVTHNEMLSRHVQNLQVDASLEYYFLPISFFKTHKIYTDSGAFDCVFSSSGTTGIQTSRHYVKDLDLYEQSFLKGFEYFYGDIREYCVLGLLPSYLERQDSSLVYMVDKLIALTCHPQSGFYLDQQEELLKNLMNLEKKGQKTLLIGVSFALLYLAENYKLQLNNTIVMETGGMKGRRKELTREELHAFLCYRFGVEKVHSEYGMTELLSQAYSKGDGRFFCPPWMEVQIRDPYDPFTRLQNGRPGGINIIDLANYYSCSFIETQDIGIAYDDGSFEVLGRMDYADIRGCNLMLSS